MSQKGEKKQKEESFAKCFEYDKLKEGRGSQTRGVAGKEGGRGSSNNGPVKLTWRRGVIEWAGPSRVESSSGSVGAVDSFSILG